MEAMMRVRTIALAGGLLCYGFPALAADNTTVAYANPRPLSSFSVGERRIEMHALPRRMRADTALGRDYLEECMAMGKVLPGYPQPAFVTLGLRVKF